MIINKILLLLLGFVQVLARAEEERIVIYSPTGKRDPFRVPINLERDVSSTRRLSALERFSLDQFTLKAILRAEAGAQAMFEDPEGKIHILKEGDLIGKEQGRVSRIINSEVIVTQQTENFMGKAQLLERVLSLPKEPEIGSVEIRN